MPRLILSFLVLLLIGSTAAFAQHEPWVSEIEGRQYFAVIAADIDSSASWYRHALGVEELDRWTSNDETRRIINLRNEALFVELIWLEGAANQERDQGFFKVGFEVLDVVAVADRVGEATGERPRVLDSPQHGMRLLQIRDPDGNIVQIFEALTD